MFNYGVMLLSEKSNENGQREILHFLGYTEKPDDSELIYIEENIRNRKDIEITENFKAFHAPQEVVDYYKKMYEDSINGKE